MRNSGLWTTELKPIFKTKKLKGVIHLHPVPNPSNLLAGPFFKKHRHCSYVLKMRISTAPGACCSLSLGDVWRCLAWQLLNASGMPGWKTPTGLPLTGADRGFPLSPWNADASREQGRCETQDSTSTPASTCGYTHRPLVSLSCRLPVPRWTEQAEGQHRMQRSVSPGAKGPSLPMRGRQRGWVALACQPGIPQERSWSFLFLGAKGASSSLITFNWVRPGFRALVMQRWCLPKGSLDLPFFHLLKVITSASVLFGFQWCPK